MNRHIVLSKEVKEAIEKGLPVVALESTIISHGMPYPKNVETALSLEKLIRDNGAVPATIAIINGVIKVGLTKEDIEYIGNSKNEVIKVSKRDLPIIISRKQNGATTVSATMYISSLVGIKVFATGGIGGVHRFQDKAMDISNDLEELGTTNVIVVCAGVKSILDIANTLEYLETKGVPVLGFKTLEMPAFYTRTSNISLEYKSDTEEDIASIAYHKWDLGINGGILVANPIPTEYSYDSDEINTAIEKALKMAKDNDITGKRITPFLLKTIVELTGGESLEANIHLVQNNCILAAKIAKELIKYEKN